MKKLNVIFIIAITTGIVLIIVASKSEIPLFVAMIGYLTSVLSAIGYSLNGGK